MEHGLAATLLLFAMENDGSSFSFFFLSPSPFNGEGDRKKKAGP
jgi:hypothetical protein